MIRLKDDEIRRSSQHRGSKDALRFVPYNFINHLEFKNFNATLGCLKFSKHLCDYRLKAQKPKKISFMEIFKIWITYQNKEREKQGISVIESYNPGTIIKDIEKIISETVKIIQNVLEINKEYNDEMIESINHYDWSNKKEASIESLLKIFLKLFSKKRTENVRSLEKNKIQLRTPNSKTFYEEPSPDIIIRHENKDITLKHPLNLEDNLKKYNNAFPSLKPKSIHTKRVQEDLKYITYPIRFLTQEEINIINKGDTQKNIDIVPYNFSNQEEFIQYSAGNGIESLKLNPDTLRRRNIKISRETRRGLTLYFILQIWINYQNKERQKQGIPLINSYNPKTIINDIKEIILETVQATQHLILEKGQTFKNNYDDMITNKIIGDNKNEPTIGNFMQKIYKWQP